MKRMLAIAAIILLGAFQKAEDKPPRYDIEEDRIFVINGSGKDLEVAIIDVNTMNVVNLKRSKMDVTALKVSEDGKGYSIAIITKIGSEEYYYVSEKILKHPEVKNEEEERRKKHNEDLINKINKKSYKKA